MAHNNVLTAAFIVGHVYLVTSEMDFFEPLDGGQKTIKSFGLKGTAL